MSRNSPEARSSLKAPATRLLRRRDFLKSAGAGVLVVAFARDLFAQAESGGAGRRGPRQRTNELDAWVHIAEDGTVTFFTGKTEVGQNIRTSLTQTVADELPVPLAAIRMVMADTDLTPFDGGTVGSRTTPDMGPVLRRAAATARETLLELAAANWKVERGSLGMSEGKIRHAASGRSVGIGELTRGRRLQRTVADDVQVKKPNEWTIAGHSLPKVEGRAFVTGKHRFTSDMSLPGMLFGQVLRPPAFGATLVSLDASAAGKLAGVTAVREGEFVGVTAPSAHEAGQALAALKAEWKAISHPSHEQLYEHLRNTARRAAPSVVSRERTLQKTYHIAYIAHAPLEPRAALAQWQDNKMTVWTGTQRPFGVRDEIAQALKIPATQIRVIVPDTGSAYGGKHTGEAAVEAARLAKACGQPVKLVWTREEEFTWAYFRPAGVIDVTASLREDGSIGDWSFHNINSGNAGIRAPYKIESSDTQYHRAATPLKQGSYRALASTANHFARESHIDELSRLAGLDPLAFRLKHINDPRAKAVLEAAVEKFGWASGASTSNRGYGLAVGTEKGSFVATCAEVEINRQAKRHIRVVRIVQAFECGAVINPAHVVSQNEGCILQGLGGALFEAVRFEDGRILNPRFSAYRVPRFVDTPSIEVVLVNRPDLPSVGAGETPIVTIAPAIANAVAQATGIRLQNLPLGETLPQMPRYAPAERS